MELEKIMEDLEVDGLFIKNKYNLRYVTGFTGTTGLALITKKSKYFFTDSRYIEQADIEVKPNGFIVIETGRETLKKVNETIEKEEIKNLGIEDKEITLEYYEKLKEKFSGVNFKNIEDRLLKIRRIKDESEIANIKEAIRITDIAFEEITSKIKVGMKENEVAAQLEYIMK
ncbi:MAG: aminopeptidase P family protein, partial [Fusobacteriota bacterium]